MRTIRASAVVLLELMMLWSTSGASRATETCTLAHSDRATLRRLDTSKTKSCETIDDTLNIFDKGPRFTRMEGRVYWVEEQASTYATDLKEIPGPVKYDRLKSYLSGAYASDGNVLLYGSHLIDTKNQPVNPDALRRFAKFDVEPSRYVTDGRLVFYEDSMLDGADATSFQPIVQPPTQLRLETEIGRDRSNVYYGAERILEADPATFQIVDFSHSNDADMHGYYAVDHAHVWLLFHGAHLVLPEQADKVRWRMVASPPPLPEPPTASRWIELAAYLLLLMLTYILISRLRTRIKSRYQASLFSPAVSRVSVACLAVPSVAYALFYDRCSKQSEITVWWIIAGAMLAGACLIAINNCYFMRRVDAAASTVVQLGIVSSFLAIGMVPPGFVIGLASIPAGISRQCPRDDQDVEFHELKVKSLRSRIRSISNSR